MNNLILDLEQNRTLLSGNCFARKAFLSYDKTGWSLVKLNFIQLFFRNVFGYYQNTHLTHVFEHLSDEEHRSEALYSRIAKIWTEKYLKAVGNASLSDAKVICFGERHGDRPYRIAVQLLINERYREGDIVLIEGLVAGNTIKTVESQWTSKLDGNCLVMGWEPQNFEELLPIEFKIDGAKSKEISVLLHQIEETFPEDCSFNETEIALLKKTLEEIGDKILELDQYYQSKSPKVANVKRVFSILLQQVIDNKISRPPVISYRVAVVLSEFTKVREVALYKKLTPESYKTILANVPLRNLSLIEEIGKYHNEGRRLFVIGGLAHFIQTPWDSENQVKKELAKHSYVVVGREAEISKIIKLNKDMPHQHLSSI